MNDLEAHEVREYEFGVFTYNVANKAGYKYRQRNFKEKIC